MPSVFYALLAYTRSYFRTHQSLRLENMALRHQLAVYQRTCKRPKLRPADRLLWIWLSRLWTGWQQALAFVQPRTVIAWQKKRFRVYWRQLSQNGKPGRPDISKDVRELIQDMWRSNPTWGSPRIVGELRKPGITVAKSTVETSRPRSRKPPSPTWKTTEHPTAQWTAQQIVEAFFWDEAPRYLLRDRNGIYSDFFQRRVKNLGIEEVKIAPRSLWPNPYCERVIGSIRRRVYRLLSSISHPSFTRDGLSTSSICRAT